MNAEKTLGMNVPTVREFLENFSSLEHKIIHEEITEVLYGLEGEPFNPDFLNPFFELVNKLREKFPRLKYIIKSGCDPHPRNYELYVNLCRRKNWIPVTIEFRNTWEFDMTKNMNLSVFDPNITPRIKPKVFLCMNNGARIHRMYFVLRFFELNLIDKGFVSMLFHHGPMEGVIGHIYQNALYKYFDRETAEKLRTVLKSNMDKFPLILDRPPSDSCPNSVTDESYRFYDESYFNVVTETFWCRDEDVPDEAYEGYLFSEKTWKPISVKQPFIIAGFAGCLDILKDKGYKTFHPYINESYDKELNHQKRLEMVVEEIQRLSNLSEEEWISWQKHVLPIINHNYYHLREKKLETHTLYF